MRGEARGCSGQSVGERVGHASTAAVGHKRQPTLLFLPAGLGGTSTPCWTSSAHLGGGGEGGGGLGLQQEMKRGPGQQTLEA